MNKSKIISALMLSTIILGQGAPAFAQTQNIIEQADTIVVAESSESEAPLSEHVEEVEKVEEAELPKTESEAPESSVPELLEPEPAFTPPSMLETKGIPANGAIAGEFGGMAFTFSEGVLTLSMASNMNQISGSLSALAHWNGIPADAITRVVIAEPLIAGQNLSNFFSGLTALTEVKGLENLNISMTTHASFMFQNTHALRHIDLSGLDTSRLNSTVGMFSGSGIESLDMTGFAVDGHQSWWILENTNRLSKLILGPHTNISNSSLQTEANTAWKRESDGIIRTSEELMALSANPAESAGTWNLVSTWNGVAYSFDQGVLTLHGGAFAARVSILQLQADLGQNISKIIFENQVQAHQDSSTLFAHLQHLTEIKGLANLNTNGVQNMQEMFMMTPALQRLDLSGFDTSAVLGMSAMFSRSGVREIDFGENFDTSEVADMSAMFAATPNLTHLDLSGFNTSKVNNMFVMFAGAGVETLDLSNFEVDEGSERRAMFQNTNNLHTLTLGEHTNISNTELTNPANQTWRRTDGTIRDSAGLTTLSSQTGAAAGTWSLVPVFHGVAYDFDRATGQLKLLGGTFSYGTALVNLQAQLGQSILSISFDGQVRAASASTDLFRDLNDLKHIDFNGNFDTSTIHRRIDGMFANTRSLIELDLSDFYFDSRWMIPSDVEHTLLGTDSLSRLTIGGAFSSSWRLENSSLPDTIPGFTDRWQSTDGRSLTTGELRHDAPAGTWQRVSSLEAVARNFAIASEADNHDLEGWLMEMLYLEDTAGHHHEALDYKDLVAQIHEQLGSTEGELPTGRHELSLVHHQDPHTQIPVNFTLFVTNDDTALALGDYFIQFEHITDFDASARENLAGDGLLKAANFTKYEIETDKASSDLDNIVFDQEEKEALVNGDKYGEHLVSFTLARAARAGAGGTVRVNLVEERPTTPGPTPTPAPEPESEEEASVDEESTDDVQVQEPSETPDSLPQTGEIAASSALLLGLGALLTALGLKKKSKK